MDEQPVKAIIMGNRRIDPYSRDLDSVCPSSPGWPQFMRVFPILDWHYTEVWSFLRGFNLSYCRLYDEGYTSLGEQDNTIKNPYLKKDNNEYMPAYELQNEEWERESRVKK